MVSNLVARMLQGVLLTGASALLPAYQAVSETGVALQMVAQSASREIVGTVVEFGEADENEWLLQTGAGTVIVDAGPRWYQVITLNLNETVTISGEYDGGEFDAFTITRADGTVVTVRQPEGPPPWAGGPNRQSRSMPQTTNANFGGTTISGQIMRPGEANENEWLLETANGTVIVDAGDRNQQFIDLSVGETVIITGEYDDSEFDAFTITRADGTVIEVRQED